MKSDACGIDIKEEKGCIYFILKIIMGILTKDEKKIQTMLNALDTLCEDVRWHPLFTSHMFYFNMEMIS